MTRSLRYDDPLDLVWIQAATRIGFRVERTADAYATTDGRGRLLIGTEETLDPDDCLAQMIFHELCHSLVEGEDSLRLSDWGLDNETDKHLEREHACLRVQATLAWRHGLSGFFAATTEHRDFYFAKMLFPLEGEGPDVVAARLGVQRAEKEPWAPHLGEALRATARIVRAVSETLDEGSPSLFGGVVESAPNALGLAYRAGDATCAGCAWHFFDRRGGRCRHDPSSAMPAESRACERFEREVACETCGACCREAYELVPISARDPFRRRHPELVTVRDGAHFVRREGVRCAALEGDGAPDSRFACRVYDDRPRCCRDLARTGEHCLTARRRVGLSL